MPFAERLDWERWLNRIFGVTPRSSLPEIVGNVQPVRIVGDDRETTPRIETAVGCVPFGLNAVPGNFRTIALTAFAAGGIRIDRFFAMNPGGAGSVQELRFIHAVIPPPAGAAFALTPHSSDPARLVVSRHDIFTTAASLVNPLAGGDHVFMGGSIQGGSLLIGNVVQGPIYVPPGQSFAVEPFAASVGLAGHIWFTELDAPASR